MTAARTPGLDREWERITQNPDNVIVSDSIRGAVMQMLEPDPPSSPPPGVPAAQLVSEKVTVSLQVLKTEMSTQSWAVSGLALVTDGETVISSTPGVWQRLDLIGSGGDSLRSLSLAGLSYKTEVEFTPGDELCTVKISCAK